MVVAALGDGEMMVCEWSSASRILAMRKVVKGMQRGKLFALRLNELLGSPRDVTIQAAIRLWSARNIQFNSLLYAK
jgi:hypothetical protein